MSLRVLAMCFAVFGVLLAISPGVSSRADSADFKAEEAAILRVLSDQQTAWNQGDVASFMKGYWNSPGITFAGSSGVLRGWETVQARYLHQYPDQASMGHLGFSELEVRSLGGMNALVLGRWHLSRKTGDLGGVFSLVFQRFPEGWKIIHDHTSADSSH